ncbi:MAG: hypothetical protein H6577_10685 [Lewinellaceae bacterium]|nr:hypothetical protein [Lewinellaceae bacterium]
MAKCTALSFCLDFGQNKLTRFSSICFVGEWAKEEETGILAEGGKFFSEKFAKGAGDKMGFTVCLLVYGNKLPHHHDLPAHLPAPAHRMVGGGAVRVPGQRCRLERPGCLAQLATWRLTPDGGLLPLKRAGAARAPSAAAVNPPVGNGI